MLGKLHKVSPRAAVYGLTMLLLMFLWSPFLAAQAVSGTIVGRVLDPSGAAVPRATVSALNEGTGYQRTVIADETGGYLMTAMPVGTYTISAEQPGFNKARRDGVVVTINQNVRVDLTLAVGQVAETIEVKGTATDVDTRQASITHLMDQKRMIDLPLNGRNPASLIELIPGVASVSVPTRPSINGVVVRMNGTKGTSQQFLLDGAPFNAVQRSDGLPLPPPDVVQEFRVQANAYSAEYGRNAGGVFSTVTKSGTNELHGSAWEYLRNDKLNARSFFSPTKPTLRQNQFGFTLGGPVVLPHLYDGRNRTFFLGSYQGTRIRELALRNSALPATEPELRGDFSRAQRIPTDPLTGQPFLGGIVPASRFDPAAVRILQRLPPPNLPDGRYQQQASQTTDSDQYFIKIDQQIKNSNTLSVKYWDDRGTILDPWPFGGNLPWSPGVFRLVIQNLSVNDTHIFTPNLINEARVAYTRRNEERFNTVREDVSNLGIAIARPAQPFLPTIAVTGRFTLGTQINGIPTKLDNVLSLVDTVSWTKGPHTLKFGFSREASLFQGRPQFDNGSFTFSGQITSNALADFLIGRPVNFSQNIGRQDNHTTTYWGFFVQDDYKVSPRVTLNLGLRYQYDTRIYQRDNHTANFMPGRQSQTYPRAPVGLVYPGDFGLDRSLYNPDRNNFAPRVGVAWDVRGNGKTSVRAGYGVFYQLLIVEMANFMSANAPFAINVSLSNPFSLSNPWQGQFQGGVNDPISTFNPDPATAVFQPPFVLRVMDPNIRNGYIHQYSLSLQRQLPVDTLLEVAYVGNNARKMVLARQLNPAVPGPGATVANTEARRSFMPGVYSGITYFEGSANSSYNALQVSANKRFSRHYLFSLAYTWSKTIDVSSDEAIGASVSDPGNPNRDRGPAAFDVRHLFSGSVVWEPPYLLGNRNPVVRHLFGGWSLAGLWRVRSGGPIGIVSGRDNSLTAVGSDRPNVLRSPDLPDNRSRQEQIARWFDPTAFAANAPGEFGNLGRNAMRGPGQYNIDFNMMKNFRVTERHRLQFRAEFFNLLNHASLGNPVGNFSSPNFGRILSTSDPRLIQLALRYSF